MSNETKQKAFTRASYILPYILVLIFIILSTFSFKNKVIMAVLFLGALLYKDKEAGTFKK